MREGQHQMRLGQRQHGQVDTVEVGVQLGLRRGQRAADVTVARPLASDLDRPGDERA
jgi:hypothetical protein